MNLISDNNIIYISGPMTNLPNFNHEAFNKKAKELRALGYKVFNPAEHDGGSTDKAREFYLREDITQLLKCSSVILLPGWRNSKGALLEVAIAKELQMPIYNEDWSLLHNETICEEADRIVGEDRGSDYGHPKGDFARTGRIWGAILENWARDTKGAESIPARLVGLCMVGLKMSREVHKPKRDNRVDGAGYFKTVDMIEN